MMKPSPASPGRTVTCLAGPGFRDFTRIAASDPEDVARSCWPTVMSCWRKSKLFQQAWQAAGASHRKWQRPGPGRPDHLASETRAHWRMGANAPDNLMFTAFLISLRWMRLREAPCAARLKSISNRVLLLAALAKGTTTVRLAGIDDTRVMLDGLRLGCGRRSGTAPVRITGLAGASPVSPAACSWATQAPPCAR